MENFDCAVSLLNEFPDSEAAIIIEYDHCKFAFEISLLVDTYQLLVEVVPGHIEDPWDCLVADERSWHWRNDLSSPIRCEIKKKLVEPLGSWIWQGNKLVSGPNYCEPKKIVPEDIPF